MAATQERPHPVPWTQAAGPVCRGWLHGELAVKKVGGIGPG